MRDVIGTGISEVESGDSTGPSILGKVQSADCSPDLLCFRGTRELSPSRFPTYS